VTDYISHQVLRLLNLSTRVKTLRLMQYWWKQDWTMLCCPHCLQLSTILNNIVTPDSGSTILLNIVDKCEQRGQQNIVQSCWAAGSAFFAVYSIFKTTVIILFSQLYACPNPPCQLSFHVNCIFARFVVLQLTICMYQPKLYLATSSYCKFFECSDLINKKIH
jgi:hypothetical protein